MTTIYIARRTPRSQPYAITDAFVKAAICLEDFTWDQYPPIGSVIDVMELRDDLGGIFELSQRFTYRNGNWETAGGAQMDMGLVG